MITNFFCILVTWLLRKYAWTRMQVMRYVGHSVLDSGLKTTEYKCQHLTQTGQMHVYAYNCMEL